MRKKVSSLVAISAVAVALTACSTDSGNTDQTAAPTLDPNQEVEIVFESYNLAQAGTWTDTITALIAEFQGKFPNIKVKAQPVTANDTIASVQTQLLAGNAPDVAQLTFNGLDYTVNQLNAQPLEKLFGTEAIEAHLGGQYPMHERAKTLADWNGETVGIPYVFSTPVLFYNATAFAEAGIPADVDLSTWAAVKEVAKKLTDHYGSPALSISCPVTGGNWCMQGMFRSNGARVLSEDRKTIEFGSDEAIDTIKILRDLFDAGVLASETALEQYENFARGTTKIQLQTSALQGTFLGASAAGKWELKNTKMPAFGDKAPIPTNSGSALFMFSTDPQKQAASWELIKFLTSDRAYEEISTKIGYLPLRTTMTDAGGSLNEWAASQPLVKPNLEQLDNLEPWISYPGNNYNQIDQILATAIEQAVFFGADPESTMKDAAARAQELIK